MLLALVGCAVPGPDVEVVPGVLPDGTRYELLLPPELSIDRVVGISGVPVWSDTATAIGVVHYQPDHVQRSDPPEVGSESARFIDGQLSVRGGRWSMIVTDLSQESIERQADLEMITAIGQDGLIVVNLPSNLRFAGPDELPVEIAVNYGGLYVRKGCTATFICSSDGLVAVGLTSASQMDITGVQIRTVAST